MPRNLFPVVKTSLSEIVDADLASFPPFYHYLRN